MFYNVFFFSVSARVSLAVPLSVLMHYYTVYFEQKEMIMTMKMTMMYPNRPTHMTVLHQNNHSYNVVVGLYSTFTIMFGNDQNAIPDNTPVVGRQTNVIRIDVFCIFDGRTDARVFQCDIPAMPTILGQPGHLVNTLRAYTTLNRAQNRLLTAEYPRISVAIATVFTALTLMCDVI